MSSRFAWAHTSREAGKSRPFFFPYTASGKELRCLCPPFCALCFQSGDPYTATFFISLLDRGWCSRVSREVPMYRGVRALLGGRRLASLITGPPRRKEAVTRLLPGTAVLGLLNAAWPRENCDDSLCWASVPLIALRAQMFSSVLIFPC